MRLRQGATLVMVLMCLGATLPFAWHAMWSSWEGNYLNLYQSQVFELHQRLLFAEKENKERSHELQNVLKAIRQVIDEQNTTTNIPLSTDFTKWKMLHFRNKLPFHLTNIHYYLPHLQEHEDGIQPKVIIGQGRTGVSLVIGIPTVQRQKENYLMNTLSSLFYGMSEEQKKNLLVVTFIAEVDSEYVDSTAENIRSKFLSEIASGALEVISPPASYYPEFSNIKGTLGDSVDRVKWRSKQILDYTFLMLYALPKGTFYLQLEDDIIARPSYTVEIENFVIEQESKDWMVLEFSHLGFIGKLFKSKDIPLIVEFFLMFYQDKPVDWLLDHLLSVKVCSPDLDAYRCETQKANLRIRYKPSLFQHMGLHSSLKGKIQHLKDRDFQTQPLFIAHINPPAKVNTSLRVYQGFTLVRAYLGVDCFWAMSPMAGDYILFRFDQPLKIESYLFRSGNAAHPGDQLFNTSVEILLHNRDILHQMENNSQILENMSQDGYLKIDSFKNGEASGTIDPGFGQIEAIRLLINSFSPMWVLLNEIFIKKS